MTNVFKTIGSIASTIALALVIISCGEDSDESSTSSFRSTQSSYSFSESDGEQILTISMTEPLISDATFTVALSGTASLKSDYSLGIDELLEIEVPAGSRFVQLDINLLEDEEVEGNESIVLFVNSASDVISGSTTISILVEDNDSDELTVQFEKSELLLDEPQGDQEISILISKELEEDLALQINVFGTDSVHTTANYVDDYTLSSEMNEGYFELIAESGDRDVSFTFSPTMDMERELLEMVTFKIQANNEVFELGDNKALEVTIQD